MSTLERMKYEQDFSDTVSVKKSDKPSARAVSVFKEKPFNIPKIQMLNVQ